MLHYFLYDLPGNIISLTADLDKENPWLIFTLYSLIILWLIALFSRR
ncbi:TPA: hypothetical protein M4731_003638 [Salmonella enterica]|nr:hypothetical protein [Salmonella enterica subsp. enterica serovar Montevideo]MCH5723070.1 hypothetical protein [Salmonella enterica]EGH0794888.1 hypothetical protein [Salmonella enterica subsp. enterica serovar Montevideo]EJT8386372.1 hypothetical protein [Salmonella enterica subsp. enterica serovar Montevideo]ELM0668178.1 hypothetical protein [Salmonella enterica subsp. enterica serovar Montevideo]